MPIQLRTDTSAAEHKLRKSWPFAPNPVHFADCTRFLRTTGNESDFMHSMGDPLSRKPIGAGSARSHFLEVFCRGEVLHRQKEDRCEAFSNYPYHGARF